MSNNGLAEVKRSKKQLISSLKREGTLRSRAVEEALNAIPREEFLWSDTPKFTAYFDDPEPLGDTGQTISAPHMVVMMLEELELGPRMKILEVGAGSGYNAALLGYIVSKDVGNIGEHLVISVERDRRLAEFATKNIEKVGLSKVVKVVIGDGTLGYPQEFSEPIYDRIVVTAAAPRVPKFLRAQLKVGGVMEIPVGNLSFQKLIKARKVGEDQLEETKLIECMFVPLVGEDAYYF